MRKAIQVKHDVHIYEHKRDLHWDNPLNSLITYRNKTGENFHLIIATLLQKNIIYDEKNILKEP